MGFYSEVFSKKLERFKKNEEQKKENRRVRAERPKVKKRKKYVLRVKKVKKCLLCKLVPKTKFGVYCMECAVTVREQKKLLKKLKKYEPLDIQDTVC